MKVKIVNPETAAGLVDPHTRRRPFLDPETGKAILEPVEVPDTSHWMRRLRAGEVTRVDTPDQPSGLEPVTPLTTRR